MYHKVTITILLSFLLTFSFSQKTSQKHFWFDNMEEAVKSSKIENKPILMRFGGSDWCGNCWRMDSTLFETAAFKNFALKEFVLLELDFPMKPENKLPEKQTIHNKKLKDKYNPRGEFPTVLVLNNNGDVLGKMSVAPGKTEDYIAQLQKIINSEYKK